MYEVPRDKNEEKEFIERRQYDEVYMERLADKVAEKLRNQFYREVGRNIVQKFFWIVGVTAVAVFVWLKGGKILP